MRCWQVCKVDSGVNDLSWCFCCETQTKKHRVSGKCKVCVALALAGTAVSDGGYRGEKNQCLVKHRSFCFKFFGSAVEVVLGNIPTMRLPALALQWSCGLGTWPWGTVGLPAKRKISPGVKPHQLGSLFVLLWVFGGTDLEKVFFPLHKNHKCEASALFSSIFSLGKKKKIILFPFKNVRTVVSGIKYPKRCLELQQCLMGFMHGCSFLALLPGLDFLSRGSGLSLWSHPVMSSPWCPTRCSCAWGTQPLLRMRHLKNQSHARWFRFPVKKKTKTKKPEACTWSRLCSLKARKEHT